MRIETLMWQQHTVTVQRGSLKLGKVVSLTSISGEDISFTEDRLVWVSKQKDCLRVCYNRLVPTSGVSGLKFVKKVGKFIKLHQGKTGTELLVNPRYHKRYEDAA